MASNDYYFFTDAYQQSSNATSYLEVQTADKAFGPIIPSPVGKDEYRVTSLHKASFNPTAYAVCDGIVCVQRIPSKPLVNIILKPLVQPALNFAPIKYILYKGILESSLINGTEVASPDNDLTKAIWEDQKRNNAKQAQVKDPFAPPNPLAEVLGVGLTSSPDFIDTASIDNLFYRTGAPSQLLVKGGSSIGQFDKAGFGLEVLMEGLAFHHSLSLARQLENKISVATLIGSETPAQLFDHWHAKEQVLGFMDPCAFYGSFFLAGIQAKTSSDTKFALKAGNSLYHDVLFPFANRNKAYLDIRNEHNFSFNYFGNYGGTSTIHGSFKLSYNPTIATDPAPIDYYASKWPILTLTASSFPAANTAKARNAFRIQLPVGDNPQPLLYVSQGYRDINSKGNGFPMELKNAERFYHAYSPPVGGYTTTKNDKGLGLTSMRFVVPNVTGQSVTTPVSCYIRLKYLKQQQGATSVPTVIQSSNYLDNLVYPIDLRVLFSGTNHIMSSVYDEEVYMNAQSVAGLKFDFIGKIGIARDANNTSFFLMPTNVRTNEGQSSALVTLSGEVSDYPGSYPNFIALKYPLERVRKSELIFSDADKIPIAKFISDADAAAKARFQIPDFNKLFIIVVANAAFDSWKNKVTTAFKDNFRVYLGVKNLKEKADNIGVKYTSFELILRGFAFNANADNYEVLEMNTDLVNNAANVEVFVDVST